MKEDTALVVEFTPIEEELIHMHRLQPDWILAWREEQYTLLFRAAGWPEWLRERLFDFLRCCVNFDGTGHPKHLLFFGHIAEVRVREIMRGVPDFTLVQVKGRHNEMLPFTPQML